MNKSLVAMGGGVVLALSAAALMGVSFNSDPVHVVARPSTVDAPVKTVDAPKKAPAPKKQGAVGVSHDGVNTYYTVQPFDIERREGTLTFIAQRFHTTVDQLVAWNKIQDRDVLHVHQRLRVQ